MEPPPKVLHTCGKLPHVLNMLKFVIAIEMYLRYIMQKMFMLPPMLSQENSFGIWRGVVCGPLLN